MRSPVRHDYHDEEAGIRMLKPFHNAYKLKALTDKQTILEDFSGNITNDKKQCCLHW